MRFIKKLLFALATPLLSYSFVCVKACPPDVKLDTTYNQYGYDMFGYDKDGFDCEGFNSFGIHKETGTRFSPKKHDVDGYSNKGVFEPAFAIFRLNSLYNRNGYNSRGFNRKCIHKDTETEYDPDGYDVHGFDCNGIHKDTKSKWSLGGFNVEGFKRSGFNVFTGCYRGMDGNFRL